MICFDVVINSITADGYKMYLPNRLPKNNVLNSVKANIIKYTIEY